MSRLIRDPHHHHRSTVQQEIPIEPSSLPLLPRSDSYNNLGGNRLLHNLTENHFPVSTQTCIAAPPNPKGAMNSLHTIRDFTSSLDNF